MRPDVVTFWHGPLDALRRLCLRSQVAAGHNVTVYSFEPLARIARRRRQCRGRSDPAACVRRKDCARPEPDGIWRDWTNLQFSDFFRMRLMARHQGLWLDADVLLLKAGRDRSRQTIFRLGTAASARQFGAVSAGGQLDRHGLRRPDGAGRIWTPDWLALRHRLTFMLRQLRRRSNRLSDIRIAIYGPAVTDRARAPGRRTASRPAEEIVLRRARRAEIVFRAGGFFGADRGPGNIGLSHLAERPRQ